MKQYDFKKLRRNPKYWWNIVLLWLLIKGMINIETLTKYRWIQK